MRKESHPNSSSEHTLGSVETEGAPRAELHRYLFFLRRRQPAATADDIPTRDHTVLEFWLPLLVCLALILIAVLVYLRTAVY